MTIFKNSAQTCIIGGFEKRPISCPVLRWGETGAAVVGLTYYLSLYFFSTVKFKDILG